MSNRWLQTSRLVPVVSLPKRVKATTNIIHLLRCVCRLKLLYHVLGEICGNSSEFYTKVLFHQFVPNYSQLTLPLDITYFNYLTYSISYATSVNSI